MRTILSKFLLMFFSYMPLPLAHGCGWVFGQILWWSNNRLKRITATNITWCYPHLSQQQKKRLCRTSLIELAKTATEAGILWRPDGSGIKRIKRISGEDKLREAMSLNRGVIIVPPHFGAWELIGLYISSIGPMTALYKPPKLDGLEQTTVQGRQVFGAKTVPTDVNGVRQLYQALKNQEFIAILPDQDPGDGGVFAPFFGIQTNTMVLLPRLAAKFHSPSFFAAAQRLPWGRGYHLHFIPCSDGIYSKDLQQAATQINRGVEQVIALSPPQYQWSYKRFKTRPKGEARPY
ncbi:MAG: lysophospholipid acyltransferase family protein [Gammaproteobacteria bacterium]|nr:lysophospholipid acyltransferase family protein [Gammaproteobacteria bacterium]MDH5802033.1 lysophospholipid acyltransferase family protein [Gammaproteobacteria bacterium]